jgi:hypothetical protein
MQNPAMGMTGVVFLLITAVALYALAPREGGKSIPWLERESIAMAAILAVFVLGVLGIGLVIRAMY